MIRDPSDGSEKKITPDANQINRVKVKARPERIAQSGLPDRTEDPARLKKSEEWLKQYRSRK